MDTIDADRFITGLDVLIKQQEATRDRLPLYAQAHQRAAAVLETLGLVRDAAKAAIVSDRERWDG